MKAATVLGWHRKGFCLFWRWKIRHGKPGRPAVPEEIRELIRMMSRENPLWDAPRIYGELLKLGSRSAKPASANTWSAAGDRHPRPGRRSSRIT
jgi:hypothetical protein